MSDTVIHPIFTIGHSNMDTAAFVKLLQQHKIQTVADVRSSPYSQYTPQFNREVLQATLKQNGIGYVFLGDELGARRSEREVYENGQAVYERIAKTPSFKSGLERVLSGAKKFRIALMCAEKDPLTCHRTILVCRNLKRAAELHSAGPGERIEIQHIQSDGHLESHAETEKRLLATLKFPAEDFFRTQEEILDEAYALQGKKIAFTEESEKTSATL
jgi:uncharacterized protein (DUF488 family)